MIKKCNSGWDIFKVTKHNCYLIGFYINDNNECIYFNRIYTYPDEIK